MNVAEILISAKENLAGLQRVKNELRALGATAQDTGKRAELASKLMTMGIEPERAINLVAKSWVDAENKVHKVHNSLLQGQEAASGFAQMLGVQLPQAATRFLARTETIGPLLQTAFSTVGVLALLEALTQLPAAFEKISGAMTGWDETAKKAYANFLEENKKAIDAAENFKLKLIEIRSGTAMSLEQQVKDKAAEVERYRTAATAIQQDLNRREKEALELSRTTGTLSIPQLSAEQEERVKHFTELAQKAGEELADLRNKQKTATESLLEPLFKSKIAEEELAKSILLAEKRHIDARDIATEYATALQSIQEKALAEGGAIRGLFAPYLAILNTRKENLALTNALITANEKQAQTETEQANLLSDVNLAFERYQRTMANLPATLKDVRDWQVINGTAALYSAIQYEQLNALIEKNERMLQNQPLPFRNLPLGGPIMPGTGINAPIFNAPIPINPNLGLPTADDFKRWRQRGEQAIDSISSSIGQMFTDSITHGKNFWEAFKDLGKNAIASITRFFIENLVKGVLNPFKELLGQLIEGLGTSLRRAVTGQLFGGIAGGAGGTAGMAGLGALLGIGGAGGAAAISGSLAPGAIGILNPATGALVTGAGAGATGGVAGALGLGGGAGLLGLGALTIPVVGGIVAAGIFAFMKLRHHTIEAPFSKDLYTESQHMVEFYTSAQVQATRDLRIAIEHLQGIPPDEVVTQGMPLAFQSSNQFRRSMVSVLADDV